MNHAVRLLIGYLAVLFAGVVAVAGWAYLMLKTG